MLAVAGFALGAWVLDSRTRPLHPRASERVGSSPHEYEILAPLVRRANVVLSKDGLIRVARHGGRGRKQFCN